MQVKLQNVEMFGESHESDDLPPRKTNCYHPRQLGDRMSPFRQWDQLILLRDSIYPPIQPVPSISTMTAFHARLNAFHVKTKSSIKFLETIILHPRHPRWAQQ